mmetsp:Transcript_110816/g.336934  ORF Transcript_110816/g.336934 Transcript_110816/m.336934 type:complete len:285 (-) Transcript_110816:406-1260(-)
MAAGARGLMPCHGTPAPSAGAGSDPTAQRPGANVHGAAAAPPLLAGAACTALLCPPLACEACGPSVHQHGRRAPKLPAHFVGSHSLLAINVRQKHAQHRCSTEQPRARRPAGLAAGGHVHNRRQERRRPAQGCACLDTRGTALLRLRIGRPRRRVPDKAREDHECQLGCAVALLGALAQSGVAPGPAAVAMDLQAQELVVAEQDHALEHSVHGLAVDAGRPTQLEHGVQPRSRGKAAAEELQHRGAAALALGRVQLGPCGLRGRAGAEGREHQQVRGREEGVLL